MIQLLIALGAFTATITGGLVALRFKDSLHLILGFSAGAVVGVAFFDLIPEAMHLGAGLSGSGSLSLWLALGFIAYMALDRLAPMHRPAPGKTDEGSNRVGVILGAGSLGLHSFLDGFGVGLAFHVSTSVGIVMACAVLAHDFSDGINTMNMVLKNGGSRNDALRWLVADALAPAAGIAASYAAPISGSIFAPLLALFAGFFLYIGASELVPESYHAHPKALTTVMTLLGMAVIYGSVQLAG